MALNAQIHFHWTFNCGIETPYREVHAKSQLHTIPIDTWNPNPWFWYLALKNYKKLIFFKNFQLKVRLNAAYRKSFSKFPLLSKSRARWPGWRFTAPPHITCRGEGLSVSNTPGTKKTLILGRQFTVFFKVIFYSPGKFPSSFSI